MDKFESLPKSVKKAVRYIRQDANLEQLQSIKILVNRTIEKRKVELNKHAGCKKLDE
ncbi:hypothetical protein M3225_15010 [Priestia aryabhattai]|uniref:hypothetical protein n=1 Tax=Priestia aryabhattai TaxID=412384 RepID=UPI00203CB34B|nr:hypothetical protein [Priestia aryabhattai]MCM3771777.1 hypothetical protein [Priestia aryabhattai]